VRLVDGDKEGRPKGKERKKNITKLNEHGVLQQDTS
jgi:hypothetical protein